MAVAESPSPVILSGAPRVVQNSSSATKDNTFVYWVSPKGEIESAPDSRITENQMRKIEGYQHWKRCEAVGAREIEKVSLIISRQLFEKKKQMKVQQHLREKFTLDQLRIRCKLRIAQGFSKNDEEMNKRILQRAERTEELLYSVIASEFDPAGRTSALAMELRSESTSPLANVGKKRTGVA